jgi:hypothetical protein
VLHRRLRVRRPARSHRGHYAHCKPDGDAHPGSARDSKPDGVADAESNPDRRTDDTANDWRRRWRLHRDAESQQRYGLVAARVGDQCLVGAAADGPSDQGTGYVSIAAVVDGGAEKQRMRPEDLLARFEEVRRTEQLDESAAEML